MDLIPKQIYFDKKLLKKLAAICKKMNTNLSGTINLIMENNIDKFDSIKISKKNIVAVKEKFDNAGKVGRPSANTIYEEKLNAISDCLQKILQEKNLECATAIQAADWLNEENLLKDSKSRPGLPLRNILRNKHDRKKIKGAKQLPPVRNGRWYIFNIKK